MNFEEFYGQVYEMKCVMDLVIRIGLMQLQQSDSPLGNLLNSFFPIRADCQSEVDFDPSDSTSADFGPRIQRFVL